MAYSNSCRTCLTQGDEMRHVDSVLTIAGDEVCLSDILHTFYDYKVSPDDELPQYLCITCIHQLTTTYSFKVLMQTALKRLTDNSEFIESYDEDIDDDLPFDSDNDIKPELGIEKSNANGSDDVVYEHTEKAISNVSLYCTECKENFTSASKLFVHCHQKHPAKRKSGRDCDFCNDKFEDFRSLIIHRKFHFAPYVCENCWNGFHSLSDLHDHPCQKPVPVQRSSKSKEPEKVLRQCDQCGKSYPTGYIKMHMLIHSEKKSYSCKYCPKKFKVPCGLNSHVLWNHKRTRNHKCDVCGTSFVSASSKSAHIRKHHLKEKKHMCETCGKKFFSKSEIQRHMLTHSGVKNFHCHMCDKSYQTRYGLNLHLKQTVHTQVSLNNI